MTRTREKPSPSDDAQALAPRPLRSRGVMRQFIISFALYLLGLYAFFFIFTRVAGGRLYDGFLQLNAIISGWIIRALRSGVTIQGAEIKSAKFHVVVAEGCDPLQPMMIFVAGVLAMPSTVRAKLIGVIAGLAALLLVNAVRIASLFLAGETWPNSFETLHVDVWQPLYVVIALGAWALWTALAPAPGRTRKVESA